MKTKVLLLSLSAALVGCSTIHSTVLPQADGKYTAIASDGSETGMSGFALKVAEVAAKHNNKENYRVEITFACRS